MLILFEIKKYLTAYKRILFGIFSAVLTCGLLLLGVNTLLSRESLFEPFAVGVVDYDGSPETRFVFDFFNEAVTLDYLSKDEAEEKLEKGEIPAFVELPEHFAADIFTGVNTPFRLYGNPELPLQLALSKLLASGGIAYLSSSQAGIYATMDYAAEHGMSWDEINRWVLYPINIAFVKKWLEYESLFTPRVLPLTGDVSPAAHYARSFVVFIAMVSLLSFIESLKSYTPAVYARYKLTGRSVFQVQFIRLAGLLAVNLLWITPLYAAAVWFTGDPFLSALPSGMALALCVSAFGMMAASLFKNRAACGLFILLASAAMLFMAGGIVPLAYLPRALLWLRYTAIPYWVSQSPVITAVFGVLFFGVVCIVEFFYSRFSRAL